MANTMNALVRPTGGMPVPLTPAPIGFGPGGPLPAPTPWVWSGNYISYSGGVVVGNATGGNLGAGTLNAAALFQNGVAFDVSDFLPLAGGTLAGDLTINGNLTLSNGITMNGAINGATLDMGTF